LYITLCILQAAPLPILLQSPQKPQYNQYKLNKNLNAAVSCVYALCGEGNKVTGSIGTVDIIAASTLFLQELHEPS